MANLSLSLDNLTFANVTGLERDFGTKKASNKNGGSLTTLECNIDRAIPFDIMRPKVIDELIEDSSVSITKIDYNANLVVNDASKEIHLENSQSFIGCQVKILAVKEVKVYYKSSSYYQMKQGEVETFTCVSTSSSISVWKSDKETYSDKLYPIGYIYTQYPGNPRPGESTDFEDGLGLWGEWEDISLDYKNVFFRVSNRSSDTESLPSFSVTLNLKETMDKYALYTCDNENFVNYLNSISNSYVFYIIGDNGEKYCLIGLNTFNDFIIDKEEGNVPSVINGSLVYKDIIKSHDHDISWTGTSKTFIVTGGSQYTGMGSDKRTSISSATLADSLTIGSTGGSETRPINLPMRLWKRVS